MMYMCKKKKLQKLLSIVFTVDDWLQEDWSFILKCLKKLPKVYNFVTYLSSKKKTHCETNITLSF